MANSFPTKINYNVPSGYAGDFATRNPRRSAVAPEAGFRCGEGGLTVAAFGWVQDDGVSVLNTPPASNSSAIPTGFVIRDMTAIIQSVNEDATMVIPDGFPAPLFTGGDFWAISKVATKTGDAIFANPADGTLTASGTATGFTVAQGGAAGDIIMISAPVAPMPAQAQPSKGS